MHYTIRVVFTLLLIALPASPLTAQRPLVPKKQFRPVKSPEWIYDITRMAFASHLDVAKVADMGAQVLHTNLVWPYFPLRRNGGGLAAADRQKLRKLVADCRKHKMKLSLGLPPFMPVELVKKHPEWRVHPHDKGSILKVKPKESDLGTRLGCNLGPWGDYLIELCGELVEEYDLDGFSFDGNYHPAICYCPACKAAYRKTGRKLPAKVDLNDVAYRKYLVWRGEKLEQHYRKLVARLRKGNPNAVLTTWTVNAGRYGHFLYSPRAMPTRMNRLIDLPMQEWWLDETNRGASVAPAFGAAYLWATTGGRPNASEPYLMSRGNPYGTDSFPHHERLTRTLLALTHGSVTAQSIGWPGHGESTRDIFREVRRREQWLKRTEAMPWAAMLVSEQTRQFYAYGNIAERFLPHVFGTFRAAMEEHVPLTLLNDWDINDKTLSKYQVLILPNAAALSDAQVQAVRRFVHAGGGLVATGETSLFDELGRPRHDFALQDLLGVSYLGRPKAAEKRPKLDANFSITVDANYWKERSGVARLSWSDHPLVQDKKLARLVPVKSVNFRGPLVWVSEPKDAKEVAWRMVPEGWKKKPLPGAICRRVGKGKVVYLAAAIDAALWSYAYPYQRRLMVQAMRWVAAEAPAVSVTAPMCVDATYWTQKKGQRIIIHLFNGINTTANHGLPQADVPLREETIPIHGIRIYFKRALPKLIRLEPGGRELPLRRDGKAVYVEVPRLEIHSLVVGEYTP